MRKAFLITITLISIAAWSQKRPQNVIIITTDGFRWHELFKGMDSALANNPQYNQEDSELIYKKYWDNDYKERRKKLMPFFWSTVVAKGQVYGNRNYNNSVNNANAIRLSFPGYSEIMTGFVDTNIKANNNPANPNENLLEFLNKQKAMKGRVAAFGAWNAFDRILNEQRSGIPVINAFDPFGGRYPNANERLMNAMNKEAYKPFNEAECLDVFTHFGAMEYLKNKKPRALYIAYGETDEWAHAGQYRSYLDAAHQVDAWLKQIWDFIQSDPQYKNNTLLFITTDHGRGAMINKEWVDHGVDIRDANEIWFAAVGPNISSRGEIMDSMQIYQRQFAQTIAKLLGYTFTANHPVAEEISNLLNTTK